MDLDIIDDVRFLRSGLAGPGSVSNDRMLVISAGLDVLCGVSTVDGARDGICLSVSPSADSRLIVTVVSGVALSDLALPPRCRYLVCPDTAS